MMVAVPAETPVTTPLVLTVAIPASLVVQLPPGVVLLKAVVEPVQTVVAPVMAFTTGVALTVTVAV